MISKNDYLNGQIRRLEYVQKLVKRKIENRGVFTSVDYLYRRDEKLNAMLYVLRFLLTATNHDNLNVDYMSGDL